VPRLVVIEDDPAGQRLVNAIFRAEGVDVDIAGAGADGIRLARTQRPDLVLLDLHLPDSDGLSVLGDLRRLDPELPIVILTADTDVRNAVRATRLGAFDYLTKPLDADELLATVRRALETRALKAEVAELRRRIDDKGGLLEQMGPSAQIGRVIEQVRLVAGSSFAVLVLGETGTGKELVAQAIHRQSDRHGRPFVAIDCGAIPEALLESELFGHEKGAFTGADRRRQGHFDLAAGGTFFLDEVGNLPPPLQAKLLRVLESREVRAVGASHGSRLDVRFIAATNDDLVARVTDGRFRPDLYFRLAQYTISLPPLRARTSDIEHLARRFMSEASVELRRPMHELSPEVLTALCAQTWPGNVRELRNVIRQCVLESSGTSLDEAVLPRLAARPTAEDSTPRSAVASRSLREIAEEAARDAERRAIADALRAAAGNKSEAARTLRTDYKTLHNKMKSLGLNAKDFSA
jgi:DNA-binding NtrC family response regulator